MTGRHCRALGTAAILLIAAAVQARAGVIYNNGAPDQVSGNEMTRWIQTEDFMLGADSTVTDVHFWTLEDPTADPPSGYQGSIHYRFYDDALGQPDETSIVSEGTVVPTLRTFIQSGVLGFYDEYEYRLDIPGVPLTGGVTYWLGLHNGPLGMTTRSEVYWETTGLNATLTGWEDDAPFDDDGWFNNEREHAFYLTDDEVAEPASLLLIGTGLAAGLARRRRQ
jgi:hypothetical protein